MLLRKIIAVCGQNAELLNVKQVMDAGNTVL